jgi:phage terminase large subunit-like protein
VAVPVTATRKPPNFISGHFRRTGRIASTPGRTRPDGPIKAGGSVRLPRRAGWLEEFVAELLSFPGRHDDQVDALTQGLAWGRQQWSRKVTVSFYHY